MTALRSLTDRLPLGEHLQVSPFCLGLIDDPEMVLRAFDAGINFFFVSCDLHWPLYEPLRRGLTQLLARGGDIRDRIVVAAVSYISEMGAVRQAQRELVQALPSLGHLDVLLTGSLYAADLGPRVHALEDQRARGDWGARAIGASFHDRRTAATAHRAQLVDLVLARYNPMHPGARRSVSAFAGRVARAALSTSRARTALSAPRNGLRWDWATATGARRCRTIIGLRCRRHIDGILGGVQTPAELDALTAALAQGPLDDARAASI